jgi:hypothetical protein
MKVFRGDCFQNFEIKKHVTSRYALHALFFTTDIDLARLYAKHRAKEDRVFSGGFIHQFEVPDYLLEHDFNGELSHGSKFRNLIYSLHQKGIGGAIIKNVYDYPSKDFCVFNRADIIVIFDFNLIKNQELFESNVRF